MNPYAGRKPYTPSDLGESMQGLVDEEFPLSPFAESLAELPAREPFEWYVWTACQVLDTIDFGDPLGAAELANELIEKIGAWLGDEVRADDGSTMEIACKPGCSFCCSIRVTALPAEVLSIGRFIRQALDEGEQGLLIESLQQFVAEAGKLDAKTRFLKPMLCPLNIDGMCSVYPVRPMACRSHHSFSVEQCEAGFVRWFENPPIMRHSMRKLCSDAVMQAAVDVFDFREQDARTLELPEALLIAMTGQTDFSPAYHPEISAIQG